MAGSFIYDVFLSHNSQDKPRVRRLAERLKEAGLRVWFDEWVIKPGDDIYLAIERGLDAARVQVFCLSPAALGSEWVALERSTVLFRDPSNAGRRFVPLLLADCTLSDTLRRYKYLDFRRETQAAFEELLAACREVAESAPPAPQLEIEIIRANRELSALDGLTESFKSCSRNLNQRLDAVLSHIISGAGGAEIGGIFLGLELLALHGSVEELIRYIKPLRRESLRSKSIVHPSETTGKSLISAPIVCHGKPKGVVVLVLAQEGEDQALEFLERAAYRIGQLLDAAEAGRTTGSAGRQV